MRQLIRFFIIAISVSGLTSCNTDFSLNGDYEIQPIVFGLLDHREDVHYIKITKAFLGDGDNLVYAKNPDSSYFASVVATITEFNNDGDATGRVWNLKDTTISNKDTDGIFYGPEQKVYVFHEDELDSSATYDLKIVINNGEHEVVGRTELIPRFRIGGNFLNSLIFNDYKINFAPKTVNEDSDYKNIIFQVNEGVNGKRYSYKYTVRWTEQYLDGTLATFSATRNNEIIEQKSPNSPSSQSASFSGLDFYNWIPLVIKADPKVVKRKLDGIDLKITAAHVEFDQYLKIGEPITGIAQVQPEFTNLNGARGLFSARSTIVVPNLILDANSIEHLCRGANGKTVGLVFKSTLPEHAGEFFAW